MGATMPHPQQSAQATRAVDTTPDSPYTPAISDAGFRPRTEIIIEVDTIRPAFWPDPLETARVAPATGAIAVFALLWTHTGDELKLRGRMPRKLTDAGVPARNKQMRACLHDIC
jgi:hypothetical protein